MSKTVKRERTDDRQAARARRRDIVATAAAIRQSLTAPTQWGVKKAAA